MELKLALSEGLTEELPEGGTQQRQSQTSDGAWTVASHQAQSHKITHNSGCNSRSGAMLSLGAVLGVELGEAPKA